MDRPLRLRAVLSGLMLLSACPKQEATQSHVDEAQARAAVLRSYGQLFRDVYARHPRTGEYERYPGLNESDLKVAEFRGDAWLVRMDPPSGFMVHARVGKDGNWVEFTSVGFNDW